MAGLGDGRLLPGRDRVLRLRPAANETEVEKVSWGRPYRPVKEWDVPDLALWAWTMCFIFRYWCGWGVRWFQDSMELIPPEGSEYE